MALPSWYAFDVILQGQGVASLEGWSTGCVGRAHLVPAAGERPPRALGLDLSLSSGMMHVPGTVLGWILPPWEGGPIRLPSCHLLIPCHGEAASPVLVCLFVVCGKKPYKSAKLANCSNISGQPKETSGIGASTARLTMGEAASPWQAMSI